MFFIIVIHTAAYFLSSPPISLLWNFTQFAVPVFVFCSTYLFFQKRSSYATGDYWKYLKKRLVRLLKPYYVFLIFYLPVAGIVSLKGINWNSFIRELTLTSAGTEINWAVLLFVYVSVLMPFLLALYRKTKIAFFLFAIGAILSSFLLLIYKPAINFRFIMWLPWSVIILYSWFFARFEKQPWFYPLSILSSGGVFATLSMILKTKGGSLLFIENKYPPNLYFLSYGIFMITVLYFLTKKGLFNAKLFRKPLNFLSKNSYPIFFIHLLLIVAATKFFDVGKLMWWQFFGILFVATLVAQYTLNKLRRS